MALLGYIDFSRSSLNSKLTFKIGPQRSCMTKKRSKKSRWDCYTPNKHIFNLGISVFQIGWKLADKSAQLFPALNQIPHWESVRGTVQNTEFLGAYLCVLDFPKNLVQKKLRQILNHLRFCIIIVYQWTKSLA